MSQGENPTPPDLSGVTGSSDLSGTSTLPDEVHEDPQGREPIPTLESALGVRELEEGADVTYYAWSPIRYDAIKDPDSDLVIKNKTIKVGASVTAARLGIPDIEFQALVSSGAVRAYPFPDDMPVGYGGSPVDWLKEKVRAIELQAQQLTSGLSISSEFGSGARA